MSKISVTTIAGLTSGGDANTVKIESGDDLVVESGGIGIGTSTISTGVGGGVEIHRNGGSSFRIEDTTNSVTGELQVYSSGVNLVAQTNHPIIISPNNSEIARFTTAGLHLGGTGAANAISDYEEGTWTPIWRVTGGANSFNYTIQTGRYTKIGNRVYGLGRVSSSGHSGSGGGVSIQGFPFTSTNVTTAYHHYTFGHLTGFSYTGVPYGYVNSNTIYSDLQVNNNGSISALVYPSSAAIDIIFQFMYETDA